MNCQQPPLSPAPELSCVPARIARDCGSLLAAVFADPALVVWGLSPTLEFTFATPRAATLLASAPADRIVGRAVADLAPDIVAARYERIMAGLRRDGQPIVGYSFWNGQRIRSTFFPHTNAEGGFLELIAVSRPAPQSMPLDNLHTADVAEYVELAQFDRLTPREIEVFAHMGRGLRRAEIAAVLHRSEATVKRFRENIASKLGESDRCRLVNIARDAGLEPEHARLRRVTKTIGSSAELN